MKISLPQKNLNRLGLAPEKREYDLPFHDDHANRFLIVLIGLMTCLALLAAAGGMVLTDMSHRWTAGLSGHLTIEIPAVDANGARLSDAAQKARVDAVTLALSGVQDIKSASTKSPDDVAKLVSPWLGDNNEILGQVPLPTLISLETKSNDPESIQGIQNLVHTTVPDARVETHESWLKDVLRLTSSLSFSAYIIGFITAITTMSAVGGAVRARMSAYKEQLEILHLIGAEDEYITRQFQRHALQMAFIGSGAGFIISMIILLILDTLSGSVNTALIPSLVLSGFSFIFLLCIPVVLCVMTVLTTRMTVLKALEEMV